jgi:SAM-dependent methyltransferase
MSETDYEEMSGDDYELLYARYLEDPGRLLRASGVELTKDTRLLDLCCGSGVLLREAIGLGMSGANIVAVEASHAMAARCSQWAGRVMIDDILSFTFYVNIKRMEHPFDLITCRQAVNYWWTVSSAARVCSLLAPGGVFVFNTFNTPPAEVPQTKQYIHNGRQYAEIAYLNGALVQHVQACQGVSMHLTTFWYIAPEQFEADLKVLQERGDLAMFSRRRDGTTDTYVCYAPGAKETP